MNIGGENGICRNEAEDLVQLQFYELGLGVFFCGIRAITAQPGLLLQLSG